MSVNYFHGDTVLFKKTAVALGMFDGLHIAHMKIINRAAEYARNNNIYSGVMTFDVIPSGVVKKSSHLRLMSTDDTLELLSFVDFVYTERFDTEFSDITPDDFVLYLKNVLKAKAVFVGYNYRFGKNASGDVDLLISLCKNHDIEVYILNKTELFGDTVSSTRIRNLICDGKVFEASQLLGRQFFVSGAVKCGFKNGTKMGIPTANLLPDKNLVIPRFGVYAGYCTVDFKKYQAVINVGNNPTFNATRTTIECHLLEFDGDLYNKKIKIEFVAYLRDEIKFSSQDELKKTISNDIISAKNELNNRGIK